MKGILLKLLTFLGFVEAGGLVQEGQKAYDFRLLRDDGKVVQLSQYIGKWVVLYFYPKADTPGCTAQGKEYSRLYDNFLSKNAVVFGISTDDVSSIKKFKEKYSFRHSLLSDPKGEVAKAYGVKLFFGMCSRDTVLINPEGKVEKVYRGVDPKADPNQVLSYITSKSNAY